MCLRAVSLDSKAEGLGKVARNQRRAALVSVLPLCGGQRLEQGCPKSWEEINCTSLVFKGQGHNTSLHNNSLSVDGKFHHDGTACPRMLLSCITHVSYYGEAVAIVEKFSLEAGSSLTFKSFPLH